MNHDNRSGNAPFRPVKALWAIVASLPILFAAVQFTGCSTTRYREAADRETYNIIQNKSQAVPGMVPDFEVEQKLADDPLNDLPVKQESDPALGQDGAAEVGARTINLERALHLAFTRNRTYQSQKEAVYLQALALTLDRHRYTPIFSGGGDVTSASETSASAQPTNFASALVSAREVITDIEGITGTPADLLTAYADVVEQAGIVADTPLSETDFDRTQDVSGGASAGVNLLLKGGGSIALALSSNFLRFISGDPGTTSSSVLSAVFTQPLLRGAGKDIATETLKQSERDVLYQIRDFTRFRQEFAVQVCDAYYGVLQDRDIVENSWQSYQDFQKNVAREQAFAKEGRRTLSDLGRLQQDLLSNESQWVNSVRRYRESLDQFKILLGLSTDTNIVLDSEEMTELQGQGLQHPKITAEDAIKVAQVSRLDLYNAKEETEDSERRIKVAENQLKADLDLVVTADSRSTGTNNFDDLNLRQHNWSAGLNVDLPLERTSERNAYRSALIAHESTIRNYSLAVDNVKLDVRAAWRNLEQAKRNYETARQSVDLNQRRVDEQTLLAELGRATAIDQVDARNALTNAQNSLTAALVTHTIARLEFWRDMGILYIKKDGQWEEVTDEFILLPASDKVNQEIKAEEAKEVSTPKG